MSLPRGIPYFAISYDVPQSIIGWLLSPSALVYGPVTYLRLLNFVATIPITPTRYLSGLWFQSNSYAVFNLDCTKSLFGNLPVHILYSIPSVRNFLFGVPNILPGSIFLPLSFDVIH